jgi:hypothetical protein
MAKSLRLTKEMRDHIITKAMAGRFDARRAELQTARDALALAVYKYQFGKDEAIARALGTLWVQMESEIRIEGIGLLWGGRGAIDPLRDESFRLDKSYPFPSGHEGNNVYIDEAHPLHGSCDYLIKALNKLDADVAELRGKINSLLLSCSTLKQLREAWPEGEPFFPPEAPQYSTALVPITLTHDINKALGLKPVKPANPVVKAAVAAKEKQ